MKDYRTWLAIIGMLLVIVACGDGGTIFQSLLFGGLGMILCMYTSISWYKQEQKRLHAERSLMAEVERHEKHTVRFEDMLDEIK